MTQKELLTKKDYAAIGEEISHETAGNFMKAYEVAHPNGIKGYILGRNIIDQILAQPGCVGLRFYNALNEAGQQTMVYVGMDNEGNDLLKTTVVMENGTLASHDAIIADHLGPIPWF